MRRALAVLYVICCFELGVFLFVLPWVSLWSKNFFVSRFPLVSSIALNYFVRGAISGLGLADVWLALYELWRMRRKLGLAQSRETR